MSRPLMLRLPLVIALAVLVTPVAGEGKTARQQRTITIRVTSVLVSVKLIDVKPKGKDNRDRSKGDRLLYRDTLVNSVAQFGKPAGAKVGIDWGTLTYTSGHSARFDGTARLPGGTLKIKGNVRAISVTTTQFPVVGGTGRYASARGTLTVGKGETKAPNVYKLKLSATVA